jgi:hypothetical protein
MAILMARFAVALGPRRIARPVLQRMARIIRRSSTPTVTPHARTVGSPPASSAYADGA